MYVNMENSLNFSLLDGIYSRRKLVKLRVDLRFKIRKESGNTVQLGNELFACGVLIFH